MKVYKRPEMEIDFFEDNVGMLFTTSLGGGEPDCASGGWFGNVAVSSDLYSSVNRTPKAINGWACNSDDLYMIE